MHTPFPIESYIKSFITLFIVMDALGNTPIFLSLTQKLKKRESLNRFTGKQGTEILTRIMGILLTALAISFVRTGIVNG